jgi:hypothetical protein
MGETDKRKDMGLRGRHGEGLALAMLAGYRKDMALTIEVGDKLWTPYIDYSETFDRNVLKIKILDVTFPFAGVRVAFRLPENLWKEYCQKIIPLTPIERIRTDIGDIILNPELKGMLYCKDIYVEQRTEFAYGYNLKKINIDRDRGLFADFDLKWEVSNIYQNAFTESNPEFREKIFDMAYVLSEANRADVNYLGAICDSDLRESFANRFKEKHGEKAIPVKVESEVNEAEYYGRRGIIVNDNFSKVLGDRIPDLAKVKRTQKETIIKEYTWENLTEVEKENLHEAVMYIEGALNYVNENVPLCNEIGIDDIWSILPKKHINNIFEQIKVVDIEDKDTIAFVRFSDKIIRISIKVLKHKTKVLSALIHEMTHLLMAIADEQYTHKYLIQELWQLVFYFAQEKIVRERIEV